ncbi:MAG: M48 family metalloprotease [Synechococcales cyanobacterium T60_A2020_003]|nr:M48 family metalloprotease [Synechococcales cyanobacterium T60_A2020_003]
MNIAWKRLLLCSGLMSVGGLTIPAIATAEMFPESHLPQSELSVTVPEEGAIASPVSGQAEDRIVADAITLTPLPDVSPPVDLAQTADAPQAESVPAPDAPQSSDTPTDVDAPDSEPEHDTPTETEPSAETPQPTRSEPESTASDSSEDSGSESEQPTSEQSTGDDPLSEESPEASENTSEDELTPEEQAEEQAEAARLQLLIQGDRLYLEGKITEAEAIYRQAKPPLDPNGILAIREGVTTQEDETTEPEANDGSNSLEVGIHTSTPASTSTQEPYDDPVLLPPAGSVYWREAQEGRETQSIPRTLVALKLLTEQYPEFIPGHTLYAQVLREQEQYEDAAEVLERATSIYPDRIDLATARIRILETDENWLQASLAARQFATFNPDHPEAAAMIERADEDLDRFRRQIRNRITNNTIANVITGAISYAATGTLIGPLTALDSALLLLRGESGVGEAAANSAIARLDMIDDPEVTDYVNGIGQKLAALAGRDEFEYEFYVINDDSINAFALPGGKIFVNSGAIMQTDSEAQLAGLLAHELSHAVLSHGFQMVTTGNMTSSLLLNVPNGDLLNALTILDYSRDMERQADDLGTRILASAGYAADGLYYLMVKLDEENGRGGWSWLSSHPATIERVQNIAAQVQDNGYNRYAYEGFERHQQIQARLEELLEAEKEEEADSDETRETEETTEELSNPNQTQGDRYQLSVE